MVQKLFVNFAAPDFGCVTETVGNIDKGNIACGCHVECFEEDYTVSLSTSLWPSNQYFVSISEGNFFIVSFSCLLDFGFLG